MTIYYDPRSGRCLMDKETEEMLSQVPNKLSDQDQHVYELLTQHAEFENNKEPEYKLDMRNTKIVTGSPK